MKNKNKAKLGSNSLPIQTEAHLERIQSSSIKLFVKNLHG